MLNKQKGENHNIKNSLNLKTFPFQRNSLLSKSPSIYNHFSPNLLILLHLEKYPIKVWFLVITDLSFQNDFKY